MKILPTTSAVMAAGLAVLLAASVQAQPGPGGGGPGMGPGMGRGWFGGGPGMMMGPWRMGAPMMRTMCSPRGAGFAEWRIERIERLVRPTDAQKPKLDDLKKASEKASETMAAACPTEPPAKPQARLEFMEKRTEAMLQALKTIRPAFDAFYVSLSDEQKSRLAGQGPRGGRWR